MSNVIDCLLRNECVVNSEKFFVAHQLLFDNKEVFLKKASKGLSRSDFLLARNSECLNERAENYYRTFFYKLAKDNLLGEKVIVSKGKDTFEVVVEGVEFSNFLWFENGTLFSILYRKRKEKGLSRLRIERDTTIRLIKYLN